MQSSRNTLAFVLALMQRFAHAQIATWLAGGWAEELWGLCSPRPHRDVDLLYPASSYDRLDQWLASAHDLSVIAAQRFSHKRAVLCEQVMIEVVLLEPQKGGYVTNFFDGRYQLLWPDDTLSFLLGREHPLSIASRQALHLYRRHHQQIYEVFQAYLQAQSKL